MKAVVFPAQNSVAVRDVSQPTLVEPDDAILRVTTAAICGSDLHILHREAGFDPVWPIGHEFVGVVEEVGPAVSGVEVGERYLATMYASCGYCAACIRGDHNACASLAIFGSTRKGNDGGMAGAHGVRGGQTEYVRIPRASLTLSRIPDEVSDDDSVLVGDILATAFTVLNDVRLTHGEDVGVIGAGPVGQLVVMCAPLFGAARVFSTDLVPERLSRAEEYGATPIAGDDPAAAILAATNGRGVDVAIDAVGAGTSLASALAMVRAGGRVGIVNAVANAPIPSGEIFARRVAVVPTLGHPHRWRDPLMKLIAAARLRPSQIVSHTLPLGEAVQGYADFEAKRANKVVLKP